MSESNNNIPMKISQLPEATSYTDGMYYAVASASGGTQKIDANIPNLKTFNELKDINSRLGYNQNAFYTVNASYSTENNVLTCECSSGWGMVIYNSYNMNLKNVSNFEYLVLTTHKNNYSIGICLNNLNFGKLIAFKYLPYVYFVIGDSSVISGATYNANNEYKIEYIGNSKYNLYINEILYEIDLSEVSFTVDGETFGFDRQSLGLTVSHHLDVSISINNMIDLEQMENNIDDLIKYNTPNPIVFTSNSFLTKGASVTYENNIIKGVASWVWGGVYFKSYDLTFKNKSHLEYLILSEYGDYVLGITLNSSNFGKLIAFKLGNANAFAFGQSSVLVGATYNENNIYRFIYNGNKGYIVYVNNKKIVVDLSEVSLSISGFAVIFNNPFLGFVVNPNFNVELEVIENEESEIQKVWKNKKWFAFGDSITAMGYYIGTVDNELETVSTKFGHGGYSYKQLSTVYTEMIDGTTPDIITLFAGTNDFGHSGTIADMVSGMETIINGLYTAYPKVQLVIITPLQRNFDASQTPTETSGLGPNSLGLYLIDYAEKIREVAEKYSIPCLDFYSMGGINANNASAKTIDGLHPNSSYGDIMGYMIAKFIESLKPFN